MAHNVPLLLRLLASSVTAANRAGKIIRDVMSRGDLGIVNKVFSRIRFESHSTTYLGFVIVLLLKCTSIMQINVFQTETRLNISINLFSFGNHIKE